MESHERVRHSVERIAKGIGDARDHAVVEDAHPADLAQVLHHLPVETLAAIFRFLGPERASSVLSELHDTR